MSGATGDRGEFAEFAAASGPRLLRLAMLLCGERAQAQDLVQEALARVYGSVKSQSSRGLARLRRQLSVHVSEGASHD